jgi:hypothetical protein
MKTQLCVQVHFLDAITPADLSWHTDASNSAIHMAVSIHHNRALHYKVSNDISATVPPSIHIAPQSEGDVYVSMPFVFPHAVEYPQCSWEDRIIAMQCRFLIDLNELSQDEDWGSIMTIVGEVMRNATLVLPTLAQVQQLELELEELKTPRTLVSRLSRLFTRNSSGLNKAQ